MLLSIIVLCVLIGLILAVLHPFPIWNNYKIVLFTIFKTRSIPISKKPKFLKMIILDGVVAIILTIPHLIDELFFKGYQSIRIENPVFIIGQPRSGTTLLHRVLSNSDCFTSLSHYRWRFPFISIWWAADRLRITPWIERINYWPKSNEGDLASKLHRARLGDFEEHGVFLEERMFHHYFLFRRYPFPELMDKICKYDHLSTAELKQISSSLINVVKKYCYYSGSAMPWLTKENESILIYKHLRNHCPSARLIFIGRDSKNSIPSYVNLSVVSTKAKTLIDPRKIERWTRANMEFRHYEYRSMISYFQALVEESTVGLTYNALVGDLSTAVRKLNKSLNLEIKDNFIEYISASQQDQDNRQKGYTNKSIDCAEFWYFDLFVAELDRKFAEIEL